MRIVVNPDDLKRLAATFSAEANRLAEIDHRLRSLVSGLDWETRRKANIEGKVKNLSSINMKSQDGLRGVYKLLQEKANTFQKIDQESFRVIRIGEHARMINIGGTILRGINPILGRIDIGLFHHAYWRTRKIISPDLDVILKRDIPIIVGFDKSNTFVESKDVENFIRNEIPKEHLEGIDVIIANKETLKPQEANPNFGSFNDRLNQIVISNKELCKHHVFEVLSHEIGHNVFKNLDEKDKAKWIKILKDYEKDISREHMISIQYLKSMGYKDKEIPDEIFARIYARYITSPTLLKKMPRAIYDYYKNEIFNNREYVLKHMYNLYYKD